MEIKSVDYNMVVNEFRDIKPDLLDESAVYFGCFSKGDLVGVVSYVEYPYSIYLCHAYVKPEFKNKGIYKLLWSYRDSRLPNSNKPIYAHCNVDSLKNFINNGYSIEKALFKVVKKL